MPTLLGSLKPAVAVLFVVPVAFLSGCSPYEPTATQPGTTPPIWTGAPAPAGAEMGHGGMEMDHGDMGAMGHGGMPAAASPTNTLTAQINAADGTQVAAATIEFRDRDAFATVTIQTTAPGLLAPGAHGLHIHTVGKCEANSVAPTGGATGDFLSAGGHFQGGGVDAHPNHAGDLSSLQVRGDGSAILVTTTNAFDMADLLDGAGTAIIIHANSDNFANIPADRYQQIAGGAPGPDEATLATGDGGKRVACGVISAG
jgi:Cu-Zn family superoxide dismutase